MSYWKPPPSPLLHPAPHPPLTQSPSALGFDWGSFRTRTLSTVIPSMTGSSGGAVIPWSLGEVIFFDKGLQSQDQESLHHHKRSRILCPLIHPPSTAEIQAELGISESSFLGLWQLDSFQYIQDLTLKPEHFSVGH